MRRRARTMICRRAGLNDSVFTNNPPAWCLGADFLNIGRPRGRPGFARGAVARIVEWPPTPLLQSLPYLRPPPAIAPPPVMRVCLVWAGPAIRHVFVPARA